MIEKYPLYSPGKTVEGKIDGYDVLFTERTVGPKHDPYAQRVVKIAKDGEKVVEANILFHDDPEAKKINKWLKENLGTNLDELEAACMEQEAAAYHASLEKAAKESSKSTEEVHEEWEAMEQAYRYGGP